MGVLWNPFDSEHPPEATMKKSKDENQFDLNHVPAKKAWWWLSFADGAKPKGQQFLGVVMVYAESIEQALLLTHVLAVNPGGEVEGWPLPESEPAPPPWFQNRLLSHDDVVRLQGPTPTLGEAKAMGFDIPPGECICDDCNARGATSAPPGHRMKNPDFAD